MKNASPLKSVCCLLGCLAFAGCGKKFDPASGEVQPSPAIETGNAAIVSVQKPQQYPLVTAGRVETPNKLDVTGSVFPDINREIPVISLASGRVVDIRARSLHGPDSNPHPTFVRLQRKVG